MKYDPDMFLTDLSFHTNSKLNLIFFLRNISSADVQLFSEQLDYVVMFSLC